MEIIGGTFNSGTVRITPAVITNHDKSRQVPAEAVETPEQLLKIRDHLIEVRDAMSGFEASDRLTPDDIKLFLETHHDFSEIFNELFDRIKFPNVPGSYMSELEGAIQDAVATAYAQEGPTFRSDVGLEFDFRSEAEQVIDNSLRTRQTLRTALRSNPEEVNALLFGSEDERFDGLVERLQLVFDAATTNLSETFSDTGTFVNQTV